jgi:Na+-transporting NADH:ubiquinone oxidoreductase subunit C
MQPHSNAYTVAFAAALCFVCALLVSSAAVGLHERQAANALVDQRKKVLAVTGLIGDAERPARERVNALFEASFEPRLVRLSSGEYVDGDANAFDQRAAAMDPETSAPAPPNAAKVRRLPELARVFLLLEDGEIESLVLPIEGMGLWSTLYGYLALDADARTIRGITFYEHGETAGLGGEVDNPRWKALWPGRRAFDESWQPRIAVIKGAAGDPEEDPYRVDGLSGATLTCNGVSNALAFWLGDAGFGPYLKRYREERGME